MQLLLLVRYIAFLERVSSHYLQGRIQKSELEGGGGG